MKDTTNYQNEDKTIDRNSISKYRGPGGTGMIFQMGLKYRWRLRERAPMDLKSDAQRVEYVICHYIAYNHNGTLYLL